METRRYTRTPRWGAYLYTLFLMAISFLMVRYFHQRGAGP
jgi:hypothetical protein